MASETTLAAAESVTPAPERTSPAADLLARLTPDDLHPARLTGLHAWLPWGLTARPATDHRIRLLATDGGPAALDRQIDHLQTQLQRPTWPPRPPLQVHRHGTRLDCQDTNGHRSMLHFEQREGGPAAGRDVVTRDGWPIVDEIAALNDRLDHIDLDRPAHDDLTDLTRWVHHKMTAPTTAANLTCPLPQLLRTQAVQHPDASTRLATILEGGIPRAGKDDLGPLTYLQDQHRQAAQHDLSLGSAVLEARAR